MFKLEQVGLRLQGKDLLTNLHGQIKAGQLTALVGPNGAGKSSLLRMLAGLQAPTCGHLSLCGQPMHRWSSAARSRQLAWLGQFPPHSLALNVHDYVALGRRPYQGMFSVLPQAQQTRLSQVLQQFDLHALAQRRWSQLSGGERQRASLARLAMQDCPIWLLDEPTNHLDLKHQALLLRSLRAQVEGGRTAIVVLHDLALAARWADVVLLLANGRLQAQGSPQQVLQSAALSAAYDCPVHTTWAGHSLQLEVA